MQETDKMNWTILIQSFRMSIYFVKNGNDAIYYSSTYFWKKLFRKDDS